MLFIVYTFQKHNMVISYFKCWIPVAALPVTTAFSLSKNADSHKMDHCAQNFHQSMPKKDIRFQAGQHVIYSFGLD